MAVEQVGFLDQWPVVLSGPERIMRHRCADRVYGWTRNLV